VKHTIMLLVLVALFGGFVPACFQARPPAPQQSTQQPASTPEPEKRSLDTLIIKGVMARKDGSPAGGQSVTAYPLDKSGTPLFISVIDDKPGEMGPLKTWNPQTKSDPSGRFEIQMPRISRIGNDPVTEVSLGLGTTPDGLITFIVSSIAYVNPDKKEEKCFVKAEKRLPLLRDGNTVLKVKADQNSTEVDLGKITIQ
jgi:hypothetical protein